MFYVSICFLKHLTHLISHVYLTCLPWCTRGQPCANFKSIAVKLIVWILRWQSPYRGKLSLVRVLDTYFPPSEGNESERGAEKLAEARKQTRRLIYSQTGETG